MFSADVYLLSVCRVCVSADIVSALCVFILSPVFFFTNTDRFCALDLKSEKWSVIRDKGEVSCPMITENNTLMVEAVSSLGGKISEQPC